jgi:hypothetical protein
VGNLSKEIRHNVLKSKKKKSHCKFIAKFGVKFSPKPVVVEFEGSKNQNFHSSVQGALSPGGSWRAAPLIFFRGIFGAFLVLNDLNNLGNTVSYSINMTPFYSFPLSRYAFLPFLIMLYH